MNVDIPDSVTDKVNIDGVGLDSLTDTDIEPDIMDTLLPNHRQKTDEHRQKIDDSKESFYDHYETESTTVSETDLEYIIDELNSEMTTNMDYNQITEKPMEITEKPVEITEKPMEITEKVEHIEETSPKIPDTTFRFVSKISTKNIYHLY